MSRGRTLGLLLGAGALIAACVVIFDHNTPDPKLRGAPEPERRLPPSVAELVAPMEVGTEVAGWRVADGEVRPGLAIVMFERDGSFIGVGIERLSGKEIRPIVSTDRYGFLLGWGHGKPVTRDAAPKGTTLIDAVAAAVRANESKVAGPAELDQPFAPDPVASASPAPSASAPR